MLRLIMFLLFLIFSVWLGITILHHPGFLLIAFNPWIIQIPIWLSILGVLLILCIFYFLISSIDHLNFFWFRVKNWFRFRRDHQLFSKTQEGLACLIEGRWQKAEHLLIAGMSQTFEPLINLLAAAKAAQEQGSFERRDSYIEQAYHLAPRADLAIGLTLAELQLEKHQLQSALTTLKHLQRIAPRHQRVLFLLEKTYIQLGDFQSLQNLLPALSKANVFNKKDYVLFEKNIYHELLTHASPENLDALHALWNQVPRATKKNPNVVAAYAQQLVKFSAATEAENLIRSTLKTDWQPDLITIYSTLPFANLNRQLILASAWLKQHGEHPELYLLLARLCVKIQLWGKAKDYFERCLAKGPNSQAYLEYGNLLEYLNDHEKALTIYRQGLETRLGYEKDLFNNVRQIRNSSNPNPT